MGINAEVMPSSGHSNCHGCRVTNVHVQQGVSGKSQTARQTHAAKI